MSCLKHKETLCIAFTVHASLMQTAPTIVVMACHLA